MSDIAAIADGLSEAQRRAILAASEVKGGLYWTTYRVGDSALANSGTLTPLGMQVREYLEGKS